VEAVRFHDSEKRLVSGCAAGIIKVWDVEESKSLLPFLRYFFKAGILKSA